ncbi:serine hydrolase domain-containing protein [Streptomyces jumonjinensis]|uniref:serine hydrolase domain-containing protein n=1 Tax=Streptomyces jumonjinensis TaxID=1945 RepID=UPI0037B4F3B8
MSDASTAAALLDDGIRTLLDDEHIPAAAGAVVRGADRTAAAAGHLTRTDPGADLGPGSDLGPGLDLGPGPGPGPGPGQRPAPAGPDTLFAVGSLTKTLTALLLAEMAATGAVAYDDPIEAHLPREAAPRPGGAAITLADLATHTGGLPRLPRNLYRRGLRQWRTDPYARYRLEDLYRATARLRPGDRPRRVRYSTFGVGLLGQLLANAAGVPYPELLTARVLGPLGMRDTCVPTAEVLTGRAATGHRRGRAVPHWRFDALSGAGALYSSAADLLRYLQALLNPASAPGPLAHALAAVREPWYPCGRGPGHKGLGWDIREVRGRTLIWHTGGTSGFTAFAGFSPDAGAGIAIVANTTPTPRQPVIRAGRRLFRDAVFS